MTTTLYDAPGITSTVYDPISKVILVSWQLLSGHEHLRPCVKQHVHAVMRGAQFLVIDLSVARGVPSQSDQDWFAREVFPAYARNGLKALINVQAQSALTKLGSAQWTQTASSFGFDTFDAATVPAALELIATRYRVQPSLSRLR